MGSEREPTGRTPDRGADHQAVPGEAFDEQSDPSGEFDTDAATTWADDPDGPPPPGANTALPPKMEAWRRRSAAGAILTGFALGLQEALETRKDEPSIVLETSGEPPKDLPVEAEFEYGRPRQSVVQIRPWLLPDNDGSATTAGSADTSDKGTADTPSGEQEGRAANPAPPESAGGR